MDATRPRRTRDTTRQHWYAYFRQCRFSQHMGFGGRRFSVENAEKRQKLAAR
jgi:hypothetical protein